MKAELFHLTIGFPPKICYERSFLSENVPLVSYTKTDKLSDLKNVCCFVLKVPYFIPLFYFNTDARLLTSTTVIGLREYFIVDLPKNIIFRVNSSFLTMWKL